MYWSINPYHVIYECRKLVKLLLSDKNNHDSFTLILQSLMATLITWLQRLPGQNLEESPQLDENFEGSWDQEYSPEIFKPMDSRTPGNYIAL